MTGDLGACGSAFGGSGDGTAEVPAGAGIVPARSVASDVGRSAVGETASAPFRYGAASPTSGSLSNVLFCLPVGR